MCHFKCVPNYIVCYIVWVSRFLSVINTQCVRVEDKCLTMHVYLSAMTEQTRCAEKEVACQPRGRGDWSSSVLHQCCPYGGLPHCRLLPRLVVLGWRSACLRWPSSNQSTAKWMNDEQQWGRGKREGGWVPAKAAAFPLDLGSPPPLVWRGLGL